MTSTTTTTATSSNRYHHVNNFSLPLDANASSMPTKVLFESLIDRDLLKLEIVTLTLALIFAFFGNLIVVLTLLYHRYKKSVNNSKLNKSSRFTRMNFFIIHLSLADIYVSLGNILPMLLWRKNDNIFFGGDFLCRLVVYLQVVSVYYSTYVLIMMSIDRYEAICRPLVGLSWSKQRGNIYILIAFVCAHLQGIPQIRLFALREIPNVEPPTMTCYARFDPPWLQNAYIVYTFVMQFLLPLSIIIGSYATISIKVFTGFKTSKTKAPTKSLTASSSSKALAINQLNNNKNNKPNNKKCATGLMVSSSHSLNESINSESKGRMLVTSECGENDEQDRSPMLLSKDTKNNKKQNQQHLKFTAVNLKLSPFSRRKQQAGGQNEDADHHLNAYADAAADISSHPSPDLSHTNRMTKGLSFRQHCSRSFSKSKIKTIKLTLTVIILYIICSTPYFTGLILNTVLDPGHFQSSFLKYTIVISCLLFQLNSCVNPWIYLSFNLNCGKGKKATNHHARPEQSTTMKSSYA